MERKSYILMDPACLSYVEVRWLQYRANPWRPHRILCQLRKWGWCHSYSDCREIGYPRLPEVSIKIFLEPTRDYRSYKGVVVVVDAIFVENDIDKGQFICSPICQRSNSFQSIRCFRPIRMPEPLRLPLAGQLLLEDKRGQGSFQ